MSSICGSGYRRPRRNSKSSANLAVDHFLDPELLDVDTVLSGETHDLQSQRLDHPAIEASGDVDPIGLGALLLHRIATSSALARGDRCTCRSPPGSTLGRRSLRRYG